MVAEQVSQHNMSNTIKNIKELTSSDYKYGFVTDIKEDRIPNGINKDIVKTISKIKNEPKWLLDCRRYQKIDHIFTQAKLMKN